MQTLFRRGIVMFLAATAFSLLHASTIAAQDDVSDWNQWRGPNRDGLVSNQAWPDKLSETELTKIWSIDLGPSYSGPIAIDGVVFTTETKDKKFEEVHAIEAATGKKIWSRDWVGSIKVPFFARKNGDWIRSTPAYDNGKLYVGGIRDVLVCLDAKTGEEIWTIDFAEKYKSGAPTFGCVCSPLIDGDFLYMQAGGGFCKVNKNTGDVVWRVLVEGSGMNGSPFSSPYIAELDGKRQILVQMREKLYGVDIESGKEFWSQPIQTFRGMNILTPSVHNGGIFLSSYGGTTQMLRPKGSAVSKVWETANQGYMSSPVIVNGHAYLNMRNRTISCYDLETGERKWNSKRFGEYASLISNGKKILVLDQTGTLMLIRANPEKFELLDSTKVDSDSWAHLAIRGDMLFVRGLKQLHAFRWKKSNSTPAE